MTPEDFRKLYQRGGDPQWVELYSNAKVAAYLDVLHLATALPKPKGARSRRRRIRIVTQMFAEYYAKWGLMFIRKDGTDACSRH